MLVLLAATAFAGDLVTVDATSPHWDLEQLYGDKKFDEGLKLAKEQVAKDPNDTDLYWHIVRFMFEKGESVPKSDKTFDKLAWYQEAMGVAEEGLKHKPDDPHLLFAYGIATGRYGTTRGVLSSLFLADDVERAWLAAANSGYTYRSLNDGEVLPCDVDEGLGIFYRLVPDSWFVEKLAGTRGSMTKSVQWNQKADACLPNRIPVMKELGVSELCYGQKNHDDASIAAGKAELGRALGVPVKGPNDRVDLSHIAGLLADPSQACGYSRDGQQDLDERKLAKSQ